MGVQFSLAEALVIWEALAQYTENAENADELSARARADVDGRANFDASRYARRAFSRKIG